MNNYFRYVLNPGRDDELISPVVSTVAQARRGMQRALVLLPKKQRCGDVEAWAGNKWVGCREK